MNDKKITSSALKKDSERLDFNSDSSQKELLKDIDFKSFEIKNQLSNIYKGKNDQEIINDTHSSCVSNLNFSEVKKAIDPNKTSQIKNDELKKEEKCSKNEYSSSLKIEKKIHTPRDFNIFQLENPNESKNYNLKSYPLKIRKSFKIQIRKRGKFENK